MKVSKLNLPKAAIEFLHSQGFKDLYPPQAASISAGILKGKSVLVSAPTASGKTLIASMAILGHLSKTSGKVIYLSPLRALAAEKYSEFKKMEKIPRTKIKVAVSTGDFDRQERNLKSANVLVLTNEKMDSIIRHNAQWIDEIGLVIADEIHLIGSQDRGPTLEMVLTRLKQLESKPQIVGLSATVTNSDKMADWLGCHLVKSNWRPVPLSEGVCESGEVTMSDGRSFEISSSVVGAPVNLGVQAVKAGGQSLLFANTRARSVSLATKACKAVSATLEKSDIKKLETISEKILTKNEHTELVKRLADLIRHGVAFHHAGLNQNCRETVESEFRNGKIRLVSSTPTLAAGVNLPARRVVISSISRYDFTSGTSVPISVLEYKQLCGRAGRPQYDELGESIIVAGSSSTSELMDIYVNGRPEPIESSILAEKSLRTHVLSIIVTNPGFGQDDVLEFFQHTFGGHRSRKSSLKFAVRIALEFLDTEGLLIKKGQRYAATDFGKMTSKLYIDPLTATQFKKSLDSISPDKTHTLGFLHLISDCEEFFPKFSLRDRDYEDIELLLDNHSSELFEPISGYECNRSLFALYHWITETSEPSISEKLGVESGDMHRMTETGDWLLYCFREIAKEFERADLLDELDVLRRRMTYGIKAELVELTRLKGIGRIRARTLYKRGIKNIDKLAKTPTDKLAKIDKIGKVLAVSLKSQVRL